VKKSPTLFVEAAFRRAIPDNKDAGLKPAATKSGQDRFFHTFNALGNAPREAFITNKS
jgi:hypothetical protein